MIRPTIEDVVPGSNAVFPDDAWVKKLPTVCAYLTDDFWDDGKPREQATLTVRYQDGMVLVCLNDKEGSRSLYTSGKDVSSALASLEKAVSGTAADWRRWQQGGGKKAKK